MLRLRSRDPERMRSLFRLRQTTLGTYRLEKSHLTDVCAEAVGWNKVLATQSAECFQGAVLISAKGLPAIHFCPMRQPNTMEIPLLKVMV